MTMIRKLTLLTTATALTLGLAARSGPMKSTETAL
jgi:hypothetical protein